MWEGGSGKSRRWPRTLHHNIKSLVIQNLEVQAKRHSPGQHLRMGRLLDHGRKFLTSGRTSWTVNSRNGKRVLGGESFAQEDMTEMPAAVLAENLGKREPSLSGDCLTAPGISSSKLGQPQSLANLLSD